MEKYKLTKNTYDAEVYEGKDIYGTLGYNRVWKIWVINIERKINGKWSQIFHTTSGEGRKKARVILLQKLKKEARHSSQP